MRILVVEDEPKTARLLHRGLTERGEVVTVAPTGAGGVDEATVVELYGADGVPQMQGDDWTPDGFEQWSDARGSWEVSGETDPKCPWTVGLGHLVDCVESGRPTVTRPEHAFHALEVIQAARLSSSEGRVVEIDSGLPALDYSSIEPAGADHRRAHDPRS
jgi:predicted dehydrogenase